MSAVSWAASLPLLRHYFYNKNIRLRSFRKRMLLYKNTTGRAGGSEKL